MKNKLLITFLILTSFLITGCTNDKEKSINRNYRQDMRNFVQGISAYAKDINPNFIIIPQNGHELLTKNGEGDGTLAEEYLKAIDGLARENLFYGYNKDNDLTPLSEHNDMISFMDIAESNEIEVLAIDYCSDKSFIDNSYSQNTKSGYISFAANNRELNNIPIYPENPYNTNNLNITSLSDAKNFLYLINPSSFSDKNNFLNTIRETNYDAIIIDLFYNNTELNTDEIEFLKIKANDGIVICFSNSI